MPKFNFLTSKQYFGLLELNFSNTPSPCGGTKWPLVSAKYHPGTSPVNVRRAEKPDGNEENSGRPMTEHQLPLIDAREAALAGLMPALKAALNRATRTWCDRQGLKREALLERMNELAENAGVSLTAGNGGTSMAVFEKWLAPRDTTNVPGVVALSVFCSATGDHSPLAVVLGVHGCALMGPDDKKLRDYGQALLLEREARQRKKRLEAELGR